MKHAAKILIGLLLLIASSTAYGQAVVLFAFYPDGVNTALSCPCDGGPAIPEGTSICLFWDRNGNGPDANDSLAVEGSGYGQASFQCFSMGGYGAGFFEAPAAVVVSQIPSAPDAAAYYLQISTDACCVRSRIFTFSDGYQEPVLTNADFTCISPACPSNVAPPAAPTNCVAGDDVGCLEIPVTWQHDGVGVTGFSIFRNGEFVSSALASERAATVLSHEGTYSFYVKAGNAGGSSAASNTDAGSTYLLRFADGPTGDIPAGYDRAGDAYTLAFSRPTNACPSTVWLYIVYSVQPDGVRIRGPLIGFDSLTTEMSGNLPNDPTLYNCRVLMRDSSWVSGEVNTDTTLTVFHLGILSDAADPVELPMEFSLSQNYPNPFNPNTQIEFAVPYQADISIQIYNISGQLVKTLVNGVFTAGMHKVEWNGTNEGNSQVGSGVYLYRMQGPDFVKTHKMLMLK